MSHVLYGVRMCFTVVMAGIIESSTTRAVHLGLGEENSVIVLLAVQGLLLEHTRVRK